MDVAAVLDPPLFFEVSYFARNIYKTETVTSGLCYISHKKRKDSLETRAQLAVLRTYVENQAILEPILLYRTSKCKQTKEQGSEDCLWTHIFTFL